MLFFLHFRLTSDQAFFHFGKGEGKRGLGEKSQVT